MNIIEVVILAIVEGLTEFLPVSSTGHMILAAEAMKMEDSDFLQTYEVSIQLGAILAIVWLYSEKFFKGITLYVKLFIGFIPAAVIGYWAYSTIKLYLFNPAIVAIALVIGGIILIVLDRKVISQTSRYKDVEDISYYHAFVIGCFQCIAMIPGVSRSASCIIGGVFNGLDKKQAMEFSFLLAVPTMAAATGYDLLRNYDKITSNEIGLLLLGSAVAFVAAFFAVKIFLQLVENYGFKHFGYYRIALGIAFLVFIVL